MANAKNTIQNIPLEGELCLNTLKTDIKQFEGYNEKNSTVFGGELTNIRTKETELGNKDSTYTIFNSKGEPFTIMADSSNHNRIKLYDNENNLVGATETTAVLKDCAPSDAVWYTYLGDWEWSGQLYIAKTGEIYFRCMYYSNGRGAYDFDALQNKEWTLIYDLLEDESLVFGENIVANAAFFNGNLIVAVVYASYLYVVCLYMPPVRNIDTSKVSFNSYHFSNEEYPKSGAFINITPNVGGNVSYYVSAVPFSGKGLPGKKSKVLAVQFHRDASWPPSIVEPPTITEYSNQDFFYNTLLPYSSSSLEGYKSYIDNLPNLPDYLTIKTVEVWPLGSLIVCQDASNPDIAIYYENNTLSYWKKATGHDGNYYIPGFRRGYPGNHQEIEAIYLDGNIYEICAHHVFIGEPGSFTDNQYNINFMSASYKGKDGKWYSFIVNPSNVWGRPNYLGFDLERIKHLIIDNRYILFSTSIGLNFIYDIETKKKIETNLSIVNNFIPWVEYSHDTTYETTGIVYAIGYNVNYTLSGNPFVGLLINPFVMTNFPVGNINKQLDLSGLEDIFYSIGDTTQSAVYQGSNPEYKGTIYPIDANGNIIYPITWNSEILHGYSNNDLIKTENNAYPLIYWNNNEKIYAFYMLSSIENIQGAFSLHGQQYAFDDNNIYNITFGNGVIESATPVCYKKNMQFLGTLPTSAVFYSKFNKTFYQFTGDAVLSKMFEASDIDEIYYVGTNPASLSLWVCTDKGIYVLSETDMFRLEYISKNLYFYPERVIVVSTNDTNWVENDVSLYDIGNEAEPVPVKLATKFYGLGGEQKANFDCWYIRLHSNEKKSGKLKVKVHTITNTSYETEEKTFDIQQCQYDANNQIYIKYQPKYQTAVATQLELESDIPIYQISLGVNTVDTVVQQTKYNF